MKKFFNFTFIALNVLVLVYLWFNLFYAILANKPLREIIDLDWWMYFILIDFWTLKFFYADFNEKLNPKSE